MTETAPKNTTTAQWKKKAEHTITLPSGAIVTLRIPNLPLMLKAGSIPNELLAVAKQAVNQQVPTPEETDGLIESIADFQEYLVLEAVTDPQIEAADYPKIPYEDVEMIADIATRQRDMDAVGHHIGGLEAIDSFRRFRSLPDSDPLGGDL